MSKNNDVLSYKVEPLNAQLLEWVSIKGYENLYEINKLGMIRSLDRVITAKNGVDYHKKGQILKPRFNKKGYAIVSLSGRAYYVHRLVADTFIDNPNNYPHVNHISEDKTDNSIFNLEWCMARYNNCYGSRIGNSYKPFKCIENGHIYITMQDALNELHIREDRVRGVLQGKLENANGLHFEYVSSVPQDIIDSYINNN